MSEAILNQKILDIKKEKEKYEKLNNESQFKLREKEL